MKFCSKCGIDDSTNKFRKNRSQCNHCFNEVRRAGMKKRIGREQAILEEIGQPVLEKYKVDYKHNWYLENKERLSKENKKHYLDSRDKRLKASSDHYYDKNNIFQYLIRGSKNRAKNYNLAFDLDQKFLKELYHNQDGKCAITNIDFCFEKSKSFRRPFSPSIDRIDSSLGYSKNNVRLVCTIVNLALNEFGDDAFDKMCKSYVENIICCRK